MEDNIIDLPQGENLTSWRLGRVEKALEEMNRKLDSFNSVKDTVLIHTERLKSLEKSRDRLIAALSGLSVGVGLIGAQQIFSIFGG